MTSGPAETPSDWVTTSIPVSARFTVAISSASPAIFSSFGWSTGILRADRASARTECPALRAAFTVSSPIPLLAPMIRTVATTIMLLVGPPDSRHVRHSQPRRKMRGRLETHTPDLTQNESAVSQNKIGAAVVILALAFSADQR